MLNKDMLKDILFSMESNDKIKKAPDGRLVSSYDAPEVIGRVDHVNSRFAYIISPDSEEDIYDQLKND